MIVLFHHTLPTKQRMLEGRNDTAIVFNLKIVSENTQEARHYGIQKPKAIGWVCIAQKLSHCAQAKLLWLSQQSGNGGARTVASI